MNFLTIPTLLREVWKICLFQLQLEQKSTHHLGTFLVATGDSLMTLLLNLYKIKQLLVSVFEICEKPWVPFWENIAKLLEGRFRIKKLNVPLEMK